MGQEGPEAQGYQEMKSVLHRDLLSRVDLEKLNYLDTNKLEVRFYAVIQDLVAHSNTPLSASERDRLAREVLDEVFGLGPWSRCCRTRPSATFWSTLTPAYLLSARDCLRRQTLSLKTTATSCTSSIRLFRPWAAEWTNRRPWWMHAFPMDRAST